MVASPSGLYRAAATVTCDIPGETLFIIHSQRAKSPNTTVDKKTVWGMTTWFGGMACFHTDTCLRRYIYDCSAVYAFALATRIFFLGRNVEQFFSECANAFNSPWGNGLTKYPIFRRQSVETKLSVFRHMATAIYCFSAANAVDVVGKDLSCYRKRQPIIYQEQVLDGKVSEKWSETLAGENSLYSSVICRRSRSSVGRALDSVWWQHTSRFQKSGVRGARCLSSILAGMIAVGGRP